MATGIFNTTRVAGESIALAVVAALLAAFAETGLHDTLAGAAQAPARQALSEAAHWLSLGGVGEVTRLLPGLDHAEMLASFGRAFSSLVYVLAAITLLSAVMIFSFLTRVRPTVATRLGGVDSLAE